MKSEPQKAGRSDRALAQRLGRRGAGKDGIRGRCAGSRRPSSPAGPWLAGPGGNRRHPRHPAWKDRALPGRVAAGVTPATLRTSFSEVGRGTSESARTSVPRGTVREGRSHCRSWPGCEPAAGHVRLGRLSPPASRPDPGTQRSQGHSSLRSGDTKVRLRGGESGGRGQRPGSEAGVRGQGPLPLCGRLLLRPWPGHPLALQSLDVTSGPSHLKPFITSSRVFCPEVARPVHFPGHGWRLRSLAGAASRTGGESPQRQLRGSGAGCACFVGDGVPWRA